jgi:hypothetical protein
VITRLATLLLRLLRMPNNGALPFARGDVASVMSCRCFFSWLHLSSAHPSAGSIGWATWLFLILAGVLLLAINTFLLITARRMTRGDTVKAQEAVRQPAAVMMTWQPFKSQSLVTECNVAP